MDKKGQSLWEILFPQINKQQQCDADSAFTYLVSAVCGSRHTLTLCFSILPFQLKFQSTGTQSEHANISTNKVMHERKSNKADNVNLIYGSLQH